MQNFQKEFKRTAGILFRVTPFTSAEQNKIQDMGV
jgi:hypothetical protein